MAIFHSLLWLSNITLYIQTTILYTFICRWTIRLFPCLKWSEVVQSYPTLCDPMDCSLPGSSVHGIFQARVLEWVAISFSRGSAQPRVQTQVSHTTGRRFTIWATREAPRFPCFDVWAIVNSATLNIELQVSFQIRVLSGYMSKVGLLYHMATLFLVFWGTFVLCFIVAAPVYTSTNSGGESPFLHTLSSIDYL